MGGDDAPGVIVAGAILAAAELGAAIVLVGPADRLHAELRRHPGADHPSISVLDAPDVIDMNEAPLAALRRKPRASIKVACEAVARGEAHAVVSAGHTGATLIAAYAVFGLLDGVERPALAVTIPTRTGSAVLLDAGANVECRPEHLRQFGVMGAAYAQIVLGLARPKVGVLSIGEEAGKGTDLVREAHAALSSTPLAFVGNVDARALFTGFADVVVCDGFTGNIVLKVGEGLVEVVETLLRAELNAAPASRLGAWLSRHAFRRFRARVDYAERGAAPLLGVTGLTLVGHGRSSAGAVRGAIGTAVRLVNERMVEKLQKALSD